MPLRETAVLAYRIVNERTRDYTRWPAAPLAQASSQWPRSSWPRNRLPSSQQTTPAFGIPPLTDALIWAHGIISSWDSSRGCADGGSFRSETGVPKTLPSKNLSRRLAACVHDPALTLRIGLGRGSGRCCPPADSPFHHTDRRGASRTFAAARVDPGPMKISGGLPYFPFFPSTTQIERGNICASRAVGRIHG